MKKLWRSQRGFTVIELVAGLGLFSMVTCGVGMTIFQALVTETKVVNDGVAINELRNGLAWFASDVKMAQSTDLVDEAEPASACTLTWIDDFDNAQVSHTSSYALVDDKLVRTYDGNAHTVANRVISVSFSRSGEAITAQCEVNCGSGITKTLSVRTVMRPSP